MNAKVQNTKIFPRINQDHSPTRFRYFHPLIYDDGSLISRSHQSILFKIDFCSNLKWINDEQIFHHSAMLDHEENILVGGWFNPYSKFVKKYQFDSFFEDDAITKINSNGTILYNKSVIEIRSIKEKLNNIYKVSSAFGTKGFDDSKSKKIRLLISDLEIVESNIYQVKNQSGQDPLNFPIKVNNRLAYLRKSVESGDGLPTKGSMEVFKLLKNELSEYLKELEKLKTRAEKII